jgi:hypothetical protein
MAALDAPDTPTVPVTLDPATQKRAESALGDRDGALALLDTADGAVLAATVRQGVGWEPTAPGRPRASPPW